jgi:hypothetical protein
MTWRINITSESLYKGKAVIYLCILFICVALCYFISAVYFLMCVKGKVVPANATTVNRESKGLAPLILTPALDGGVWSASRPVRLPPGKNPHYTLNRQSGPHSRSLRWGKREKSLIHAVIWTLGPTACSLVCIPTALSRPSGICTIWNMCACVLF